MSVSAKCTTLSTICLILGLPLGVRAEFPIALSVRRHQGTRPTLSCDIILVDQRLKAGAEFDQFDVNGLRGCSWC